MINKKKTFSFPDFETMPIVGILRNVPHEMVMALLPVYHRAGLTTLEITMNSHAAEEIIRDAVVAYGAELNIGAGTVCSLGDLDRALQAGAQFIVTPVVNEEVIRACVKQGIPVFPGALSPTEIRKAWELGAYMVKVFPASMFGPDYFKSLKAPLGTAVSLLATGGVGVEAIPDYLAAGVQGFGIGGPLFNNPYLKQNDYHNLERHFRKFAKQVEGHKGLSGRER